MLESLVYGSRWSNKQYAQPMLYINDLLSDHVWVVGLYRNSFLLKLQKYATISHTFRFSLGVKDNGVHCIQSHHHSSFSQRGETGREISCIWNRHLEHNRSLYYSQCSYNSSFTTSVFISSKILQIGVISPRGNSHVKGTGTSENLNYTPKGETDVGVAQAFLTP